MQMPDLDITAAQQALAELQLGKAPNQALAQWWQNHHAHLLAQPCQQINQLLEHHSLLIDLLLRRLWQQLDLDDQYALIALGDYARQQLLPYANSVFVISGKTHQPEVEAFIQAATKINPRLQGYWANNELNLIAAEDKLNTRFITGNKTTAKHFTAQLQQQNTTLLAQAISDYSKHKLLFSSAPNLQLCLGGLKQTQLTQQLQQHLHGHGTTLQRHQRLLHTYCWALQQASAQDNYTFTVNSTNKAIALLPASVRQSHGSIAAMAQHLYLATAKVAKHYLYFKQAFKESSNTESLYLINRRFIVENGSVTLTKNTIFQRWPAAAIEMFVTLDEEPKAKRLSYAALNHVEDALDKLNTSSEPQHYWFLRLLSRSQKLFTLLFLMHQLGILERHIPELKSIKGVLNRHTSQLHPLDIQGLISIQQLQMLRQPHSQQHFNLAHAISYHIPQPELLYLAALLCDLHHVNKDTVSICQQVCERHNLPEWQADTVVWLVENQQLMTITAEQQDISNPQTVYAFARTVGNLLQLDYLYLLTIARIRAINPILWNPWRGKRLESLYHACKKALRRGINHAVVNSDWAAETRQQAAQLLQQQAVSNLAVKRLWTQIGDEYFIRETAADIAWHTQAILQHGHDSTKPLVLLREQLGSHQKNGTQLFIYTKDTTNLFALIVQTLEKLALNVVSANIITSAHGFSLDTYILVDQHGNAIADPKQLASIQTELVSVLSNPQQHSIYPVQSQPSGAVNPHVLLANSADGLYTVVFIQTEDKAGLLVDIAHVFSQLSFNIHHARITTYGQRVEDTFHITDSDGLPVSEANQGYALQQTLLKALSSTKH